MPIVGLRLGDRKRDEKPARPPCYAEGSNRKDAAMATIPSFDVPDEALRALDLTPEQFAAELRLAAAAFWYDRRQISQEVGSYIAGLNRRDFLLGISRLEVDPIQVDDDDLERELAHLRKLAHGRAARDEHVAADHPHRVGQT
jgi:hypothetical protein